MQCQYWDASKNGFQKAGETVEKYNSWDDKAGDRYCEHELLNLKRDIYKKINERSDMILRFVGCLEYEEIKKPININLGGPYQFGIEGDKNPVLHVLKANSDYIYNMYKNIKIHNPKTGKKEKYDGVSDISAIVGKNGAGKTTSLRIISAVLREDSIVDISDAGAKIKYVVIHEDTASKKLYISSNVERLLSKNSVAALDNELKELGYNKSLEVLSKKDMLKNKQQVYYSAVFDKSPRFLSSENLCDISTNNIINRFLWECQKPRPVDNERYRSMTGTKTIDDLRKNEVLDRLGFIDKYAELEKNLLFEFPNRITAFFMENISLKDQIYADRTKTYPELKELKKNVNKMLYQFEKDSAYTIKNYLAVLTLEELILTSLNSTDLSYPEISYRLRYKLDNSLLYGTKLLSESADKLGIPHEKEPSEKKVTYEGGQDKTEENDEAYLLFIKETIMHANEYRKNVETWDINDLQIYEYFDELRDIFTYTDGMIKGNLPNRLEEIMSPLWDGEIPYYSADEEGIKDSLIALIDELTDELEELATSVKRRLNETKKRTHQSLNEDLIGFENQEIIAVSREGKYEEFDEKANLLITAYNLFYETCSKEGSKEDDSDLIVKLRNKEKADTECKASFLKFCRLLIENRDCEYPKGVETFALVVDHEPVSSGYNGYFDMLTRIAAITDEVNQSTRRDLLLLLDEAELYLHPRLQKEFVLSLLRIIQHFFKEKDIQIVFASNSPFLLSDVQNSNALYLQGLDSNGLHTFNTEDIGSPFGTNISALLMSNFFMPNGAIGELARIELNELIKRLSGDWPYNDKKGEDKKLIRIIGDDVIREKLIEVYCEKKGLTRAQFMGEK